MADGSVAGAESSFALATGLPGSWTTTAGNVTLFPKINSLVANADALADLTPEQRAVITAAAEATRDWAVATTADEAAAAEAFCAAGGTVVLADRRAGRAPRRGPDRSSRSSSATRRRSG